VTLLGLLLTPVFYVVIRMIVERISPTPQHGALPAPDEVEEA
jgi:hypothetical protein